MVHLKDLNDEELVIIPYDIRLSQSCVVKACPHFKDMALVKFWKVMVNWHILNIFSYYNVFNDWLFYFCKSINFLLCSSWYRIGFIVTPIYNLTIKIDNIIDLESPVLGLRSNLWFSSSTFLLFIVLFLFVLTRI